MDESAAIVRYVNDDFNKNKMKIVFNYTRHVYFKTLDMFQEFMYVFPDAVDLVTVSYTHLTLPTILLV